jgi:lipopolysaccharide transport system permease protein
MKNFGKQIGEEKWDLIITPKTGWFDLHLGDLWRYRDLIFLFVKRDFVALYKQTILGPLWYLIQPLLSTVIFTIIFGRIANIPTDGIPHFLFYLSGIICWSYFADCLNTTSNTFIANASIFGKVYFPRLAVPVSVVMSNMIKFCIQALLLSGFYAYYLIQGTAVHPTIYICCVPLLLLQMALLGFGFGILISSMTTKYRDLSLLVTFGVQLWMYATPVVYPLSQVPERFRFLYHFNPMAAVITNFRAVVLGIGEINVYDTAFSWGVTGLILCLGVVIFSRVEKTFMDTV